jgi:hypothetical protein
MIVHYINPSQESDMIFYDVLFLENEETLARLNGSSFSVSFETSEAVDRAITAAAVLFPAFTVTQVNIDYNGNDTFSWNG